LPPTEQGDNLLNDNEPENESDNALSEEYFSIFSIPVEDIGTAQRFCPQLAPIINYLTTGKLPEDNKIIISTDTFS